jgi:opine dehydrogenase
MKISVLGTGNGGSATAFDCAQHGHEVALWDFDQFDIQISAIAAAGGIRAGGGLTGFAPVAYAGHDLARALYGAELVYVVGPAYATESFANAVKPYLAAGQTYIVCPGSCGGGLLFKKILGLAIEDTSVTIAETSTLPYAARIDGPGTVHINLKLRGGLYLATIPGSQVGELLPKVQDVYPAMEAARNCLVTILQNGNPTIHPAVSLCNAARIDNTQGDFFFYEDGCSEHVGHLMEAVDDERLALAEALGVTVLRDPDLGVLQGYQTIADYNQGYRTAPGFKGIKAQSSLDYRYFNEDVGYGMTFMSDMGRKMGVPTPTIDAVITVVSALMQKDYRKENRRSLADLGLADYPVETLLKVL